MTERANVTSSKLRDLTTILAFTSFYILLGAISLATAYVQTNTAAVWIPAGFSIGLLVARGSRLWPVVTLGAFVLNVASNALSTNTMPVWVEVAIAAVIASGNTGEALLGCYLARRFAGGETLLAKPVNVVVFAGVVATLPPLVSMSVGVAASHVGGLVPSTSVLEVMLTWYVANGVGILIVTAPIVALLGGAHRQLARSQIAEAVCLVVCLLFVSQAMSGMAIVPALNDWPRTYMIIPLLLWTAFRFKTPGALIAILLVAAVSIVGTMRGFEAFPSRSHSRSLLYLQMFLGVNAMTTLVIAAALDEIERLRGDLEDKVRIRTGEVERLLRARNLFTSLVMHDLQSPLYGVRNTLRAAAISIRDGHMTSEEIVGAMGVMDETCTSLAAHVAGLLAPDASFDLIPSDGGPEKLADLVARIMSPHRLANGGSSRVALKLQHGDLMVRRPKEVERILDGLIGNALKFGPPDDVVEVCAYRHTGNLEILVTDQGKGVEPAKLAALFRPQMRVTQGGQHGETRGRGLYLASEQASELGGRLTYVNDTPHRSTFRLTLPD